MSATLTRTTLGRLAAFSSSPVAGITSAFAIGEWDGFGGGGGGGVSGGALGITVTSGTRYLLLKSTILADRADVAIQAVFDGPLSGHETLVGVIARSTSRVALDDAIRGWYPARWAGASAGSGIALQEAVNGAQVQINQTLNVNYTTSQRVTLRVQGSAAGFGNGVDFAKTLTGIGHVAAGGVGIFVVRQDTNTVSGTCRRFHVVPDTILTVTGVPDGASVEILDGSATVLASAVAAGGVAAVDASGYAWEDARTLRVVDGSHAFYPATPPDEGVWPGDVWAFAPVTLDLALETIFGGTAVPSPTLALTAGVTLDVRGDGYVDRAVARDVPRVWRRRTSRAAGLSDFTAAPLATLAEDRLVTLDGEYLETL